MSHFSTNAFISGKTRSRGKRNAFESAFLIVVYFSVFRANLYVNFFEFIQFKVRRTFYCEVLIQLLVF
jgi:hypothetical protein